MTRVPIVALHFALGCQSAPPAPQRQIEPWEYRTPTGFPNGEVVMVSPFPEEVDCKTVFGAR